MTCWTTLAEALYATNPAQHRPEIRTRSPRLFESQLETVKRRPAPNFLDVACYQARSLASDPPLVPETATPSGVETLKRLDPGLGAIVAGVRGKSDKIRDNGPAPRPSQPSASNFHPTHCLVQVFGSASFHWFPPASEPHDPVLVARRSGCGLMWIRA